MLQQDNLWALAGLPTAPTTPPGGVIDSMRQGSIVGPVGPLHGPGRQRSHASAGQPDRPEDENQLGADNESSWAMLPENVPEDPADEPDVLY